MFYFFFFINNKEKIKHKTKELLSVLKPSKHRNTDV